MAISVAMDPTMKQPSLKIIILIHFAVMTVLNWQFKWGICLNYLQIVNAFAMGPSQSNLRRKLD